MIAATGLSLVAAGFGIHYLIQPERLGATLIRRAEAASGLSFELAKPARLSLWPRLNLQLDGVSVREAIGTAALLRAERVEIALPLSLMWSAEPQIGRIDVQRADIDLAAVMTWMSDDTASGPPAALRLPEIAAQLLFTESTVRANGFTLRDLDLQLSALRDGLPATLSASTRSADEGAESWRLSAQATPRQREQGIHVEAFAMTLTKRSHSEPAVSLRGELALELPQRLGLDLALHLAHPEQLAMPALPAALQAQLTEPISLSYDGAGDLSAPIKMLAGSEGQPLAITTQVSPLLDWFRRDWSGTHSRDPLPPLKGSAALPDFEIEGVVVEGLQVEITPDAPVEPTP